MPLRFDNQFADKFPERAMLSQYNLTAKAAYVG